VLNVPVATWIGNAAAVLSGTWGAVTRRAQQSGSSRTPVYAHGQRVLQAVASAQAGGISDDALTQENERLKTENEALWQAWTEAEERREAKQRALAASGSAMGLSLSQIVTLLALILPLSAVPSRAMVGRWVQEAAAQAGRLLVVLDLACQARVQVLCLDAIFLPRVPVLMPVALDQTYDYLLPEDIEAIPGSFVLVPFGPQSRIGIVWDTAVGGGGKPVPEKKLKAITAGLPEVPPLPAISLRFAEWVARYTLSQLGMVARMMMGSSAVFEPVKPRFGVSANEGAADPPRLTPARKRALEIAADGQIRAKNVLATEAGCTTGVINGLIEAGSLVEVAIPEKRFGRPDPAHTTVDFADAQARAVHAMRAAADGAFSVTLLDGVTGSGKTAVYFEAVARTLEQGRQALIMLPEIALTSQFMDRFTARFGCVPVEWHSALSSPERARAWRAAATGEARVVVGARSALFLPFNELGLIIVDEEHDGGFKQEDRVHYQARDMAVVRANLGKFPVILSSATPSIESHVNAHDLRRGQG